MFDRALTVSFTESQPLHGKTFLLGFLYSHFLPESSYVPLTTFQQLLINTERIAPLMVSYVELFQLMKLTKSKLYLKWSHMDKGL